MLHDRFEVLRRIHLGPVTETVEARDTSSGERVLLCTLHSHLADRHAPARLFRDQVAVARQRQHHRLLPILAAETEMAAWFTMPSLPGRFLAELMAEPHLRNSITSARSVQAVVGQLLELLVYLETAADLATRGRTRPVAYRGLGPSKIHWGYDDQVRVVPVAGMPQFAPDDVTGVGLVDDAVDYLVSDADDLVAADRHAVAAMTFELVTGRRWRDVRGNGVGHVDTEGIQPDLVRWLRDGLATVHAGGFGSAVEMAGAWASLHRARQ